MKLKDLQDRKSHGVEEQLFSDPTVSGGEKELFEEADVFLDPKVIFQNRMKEHLYSLISTEWAISQRKTIEVSSVGRFKLRKDVHFGGLFWRRGSEGQFLSEMAFSCLSERMQAMLRKGLEKPDTLLCSLGDYIYVLPKNFVTYKENGEQHSLL